MKKLKKKLITLFLALIYGTAFIPSITLAFSPGGPSISQPPISETRPAVVGGFIASAQDLTPGQIRVNYEHANFDAAFDFAGNKITPPEMSINTYDIYGAISDKLVLGFGTSAGEIIDTYGKYKINKNVDLLFGKKQSDNNIDFYFQYRFAFPVNIFIGTREFDNSPISSNEASRTPLYGLSAFLPFSKSAGVHGMVATTNRSLEWQIGLDKKISDNFSVSIQYRGYRENGDNSSTFKLNGIGLDLNYLL